MSEGKVLVERQEMPTDGLQAVTDDGNSTEVTGATEATEATGITEDTQLNTLDILPDDYDKRQFPPRTNEGSVLHTHAHTVVDPELAFAAHVARTRPFGRTFLLHRMCLLQVHTQHSVS